MGKRYRSSSRVALLVVLDVDDDDCGGDDAGARGAATLAGPSDGFRRGARRRGALLVMFPDPSSLRATAMMFPPKMRLHGPPYEQIGCPNRATNLKKVQHRRDAHPGGQCQRIATVRRLRVRTWLAKGEPGPEMVESCCDRGTERPVAASVAGGKLVESEPSCYLARSR